MPYKEDGRFGKGEEESVGANRRYADFEVFAELVERRVDGWVRFHGWHS